MSPSSSPEHNLSFGPLSLFTSSLRSRDDLTTKAERIDRCLSQKPVDLWELRELALSNGGLLTREFMASIVAILDTFLVGTPKPLTHEPHSIVSNNNTQHYSARKPGPYLWEYKRTLNPLPKQSTLIDARAQWTTTTPSVRIANLTPSFPLNHPKRRRKKKRRNRSRNLVWI